MDSEYIPLLNLNWLTTPDLRNSSNNDISTEEDLSYRIYDRREITWNDSVVGCYIK